jgi:cytochrome c oxidase cbb3-type subunit 3
MDKLLLTPMKKITAFILLLMISGLTQANQEGQRLFSKHCITCHGTSGQGGVGIPLSLPSFIDSVSDNYLRKSIRYGRPGRIMPSFSNLSDDDIYNIVKYMRTWTGQPGKTYSNKHIKGNSAAGKQLFDQYCAACHNAGGTGGHGTGVTFSRPRGAPIVAPSLNNPGFLSSVEDEFIRATLENGRAGTPMMSYKAHGLNDDDLDNLVSYIRNFEGGPYPNTPLDTKDAIIKVESSYSVEETVKNVQQAIVGKNFKLIRTQYLDQGLVEEGKENKEQVIIYFCNFNFLNKALAIDPRVGMFLPCRLTVVKDNDKVYIMAINPLKTSNIFNNSELNDACKEMYDIYTELLEEASLS